jgi:hypothetical protein
MVAQGAKEVFLDDETYRLDLAQSLLVSVDLPVTAGPVRNLVSRRVVGYIAYSISLTEVETWKRN